MCTPSPLTAQQLQTLRSHLQNIGVNICLSSEPAPDLAVTSRKLHASLLQALKDWVVACLAACSLLPQTFVNLADLPEQDKEGAVGAKYARANLLAALQTGSLFAAHAECFGTLANLAGAPKSALLILFCALLPATYQLLLALLPPVSTLVKEVKREGGSMSRHQAA